MAIETKIGLEAEFLLRDSKGKVIIPPATWDRDGFPLLAEIRGKEGKTAADVVSNFMAAKMAIVGKMPKTRTMDFSAIERIPLDLYKEANKQVDPEEKAGSMGKVLNTHGIDISDFSDQVIKDNKIQGINVSCGLHVHFSCWEVDKLDVKRPKYVPVNLPLGLSFGEDVELDSRTRALQEIAQPVISLYKSAGYDEEETLRVSASRLNKPAIHHIVNQMDKAFFDRFAPPEDTRTKYRQPGFFELKPYGFEYRSLPFTNAVESALFEIAIVAFEIMKEVNEY